jgi:ribose 5-phosphate isomerase
MNRLTAKQKKEEREKIIKEQKLSLLHIAEQINKIYEKLDSLDLPIELLRTAYDAVIDARIKLD